jgi:hypothetical protein
MLIPIADKALRILFRERERKASRPKKLDDALINLFEILDISMFYTNGKAPYHVDQTPIDRWQNQG